MATLRQKGRPDSKKSSRKNGHDFHAIKSTDLIVRWDNNKFYLLDESGKDLSDFDVYLFRGMARHLGEEMGIIASELEKHGKIIIEPARAGGKVMSIDKLIFPAEQDFSVLDFSLFMSRKTYDDQKGDFIFPLIIKSVRGSRGKGVRKISNEDELGKAVTELEFPIIVQKYLPIKYDTRVLVVGGKILGAFSRYNNADDFLTTRPGGEQHKAEVSDKMKDAALAAASASGIQIAGVDLVEYNDAVYVLEVNSSPQFKVFEKITGVNVAASIVSYIEKEYQNKRSMHP